MKKEKTRYEYAKSLFLKAPSEDHHYLLMESLSYLDIREFNKLYFFFKKNKNLNHLISQNSLSSPGELSKVHNMGDIDDFVDNYISNEKMIVWSQLIIEDNLSKIKLFTQKKEKFELNYLIANFIECEIILKELFDKLGYSWWLIEARIELIRASKEKQEKTNYINRLIKLSNNEKNGNTLFNYIIEQISNRNDEKTQITNYNKQLSKFLKEADIPRAVSEYLEFKISRITNNNTNTLLLFDSISNIIDLFETFKCNLSSTVSRRLNSNEFNQLKKTIRSINKSVNYRPFKNFIIFTDEKRGLNALERYTPSKAGNLFISGKLDESKSECLTQITKNPFNFELIHILSSLSTYENEFCDTEIPINAPIIKIISELSNYKSYNANANSAFSELLRISTNANFLNISNYIYSIIYEKSSLCHSIITDINSRVLHAGELDVFSISLLSGNNKQEKLHYSKYSSTVNNLIIAKKENNFVLIDEITQTLLDDTSDEGKLNSIFSINERCLYLIEQERYFDSIKICVENTLKRRFLVSILPIDVLVKNRRWKFYNNFKNSIEITIIIALYLSINDDSLQNTHLGFAWDWFRRFKGVYDISEILNSDIPDIERDKIIYFLSEVSTPKVLENHSEGLNTQEEVLNARVRIVKKLIEQEDAKDVSYEKELLSLLKNISIQKGLDNINQNKIYVDTNVISSWAERELLTRFEKYQETLQHPELTIINLESENLISVLEKLLNPPDEQLLYNLLSEEYLNNKQGGLNFFLSMRIRHGKFEGTLRNPLSKNNLLTTKDEEGKYLKNSHWAEVLNLSQTQLEELDHKLELLSKCFDDIIDKYLHNYLRCNSTQYPKGKFFTFHENKFTNEFKQNIINGMSFEGFTNQLYSMFKSDIQSCLDITKMSIEYEIFKPIQKNLLLILNFSEKNNANQLSEIIKVTQGQFQNTCNTVKSWFNYDEVDIQKESLSVDDCIDISYININSVYSDHSMEIKKCKSKVGDVKLSDIDSKNFCEALYIMLENIYKRSGFKCNIPVRMRLSFDSLGKLNVVIINSSSESVYTTKNIKKTAAIRKKISSGAYLTQANTEGNSGILKLRALNPENDNNCIRFKLRKSLFYINYKLHLCTSLER